MKTNKLSVMAVALLLTATCTNKDVLDTVVNVQSTGNEPEYLVFGSQSELSEILQEYIALENNLSVSTKSISRKTAPGFVSIADLQQMCKTKSGIEDERNDSG
ncbi:hypothetical protein FACS189452_00880 [Bacteroidia bacterium]|nr:hypothetical protein FACS189452_00880 [Bacteroidia bacterium]